jgi:hypothetical protein
VVLERVDELAEQMGISQHELSGYLAKHGEARVEEVLWYVWNGCGEGWVRSPVACVRSALSQNWNVKSRWKSSSASRGYRPESPTKKDARASAEHRKWREKAEELRPHMEELGQARVTELKALVLAEIADPLLREAFEPLNPMGCGSPPAVQLAGRIWEKHRAHLRKCRQSGR